MTKQSATKQSAAQAAAASDAPSEVPVQSSPGSALSGTTPKDSTRAGGGREDSTRAGAGRDDGAGAGAGRVGSAGADGSGVDSARADGVRGDGPESAAAPQFDTRHAAMRYTTLRLTLFLGALVVLWGIAKLLNMDLSSQLSKLTLLAVALLLSSAVSFIVLSKQRDAMSASLVARSEKLSKRLSSAASFEDDDEDDD
jgi:hypothetical protein